MPPRSIKPIRPKPFLFDSHFVRSDGEVETDGLGRSLAVAIDAIVVLKSERSQPMELRLPWSSECEGSSSLADEDLLWISIEAAQTPEGGTNRDVEPVLDVLRKFSAFDGEEPDTVAKRIDAMLSSSVLGDVCGGVALPALTLVTFAREVEAGLEAMVRVRPDRPKTADYVGGARIELVRFDAGESDSDGWHGVEGIRAKALAWIHTNQESALARMRADHAQSPTPLGVGGSVGFDDDDGAPESDRAEIRGTRVDLLHLVPINRRVIVSWVQQRQFLIPPRIGTASQQLIMAAAQVRPTPFDTPWRLDRVIRYAGEGAVALIGGVAEQVASRDERVLIAYLNRLRYRLQSHLHEVTARVYELDRQQKNDDDQAPERADDIAAETLGIFNEVERELLDLQAILFELQLVMARIGFHASTEYELVERRFEAISEHVSALIQRTERALEQVSAVHQARQSARLQLGLRELLISQQSEQNKAARRVGIVSASLILILASAALVGTIAAIPSARVTELAPGSSLLWRSIGVTGLVLIMGALLSTTLVFFAEIEAPLARSMRRLFQRDGWTTLWLGVEAVALAMAAVCFVEAVISPQGRILAIPTALLGVACLLVLFAVRALRSNYFEGSREPKRDSVGPPS